MENWTKEDPMEKLIIQEMTRVRAMGSVPVFIRNDQSGELKSSIKWKDPLWKKIYDDYEELLIKYHSIQAKRMEQDMKTKMMG